MNNIHLRQLQKNIRHGRLDITLADGRTHSFGADGPRVGIVLHDDGALRRILRDTELMLGETYMDGAWDAVMRAPAW